MRTVSFALACLACTSNGRRAHAKVADITASPHSSTTSRQVDDNKLPDTLDVLVLLLLKARLAVAFSGCRSVECSPSGKLALTRAAFNSKARASVSYRPRSRATWGARRQMCPHPRSMAPVLSAEDRLASYEGTWIYKDRIGRELSYQLTAIDGELLFEETLQSDKEIECTLSKEENGDWYQGSFEIEVDPPEGQEDSDVLYVEVGAVRVRLKNGILTSNFCSGDALRWGPDVRAVKKDPSSKPFVQSKVPAVFQPTSQMRNLRSLPFFLWADSDKWYLPRLFGLYFFLIALAVPVLSNGLGSYKLPDELPNMLLSAHDFAVFGVLVIISRLRFGWGWQSQIFRDDFIEYEVEMVSYYEDKDRESILRDKLIDQMEVRPVIARVQKSYLPFGLLGVLGAVLPFFVPSLQ